MPRTTNTRKGNKPYRAGRLALLTLSSPSSRGSRPVILPTPFAADHRTTVSLSRNPHNNASTTSSNSAGTSTSSASVTSSATPSASTLSDGDACSVMKLGLAPPGAGARFWSDVGRRRGVFVDRREGHASRCAWISCCIFLTYTPIGFRPIYVCSLSPGSWRSGSLNFQVDCLSSHTRLTSRKYVSWYLVFRHYF